MRSPEVLHGFSAASLRGDRGDAAGMWAKGPLEAVEGVRGRMLELSEPSPVKRMAAVLAAPEVSQERAVRAMEKVWGRADVVSEPFVFDFTDYYTPEMGPNLQRFLAAFEPLVRPERLGEWKHEANDIERLFLTEDGRRRLNIDVGYLDLRRVVLASTKEGRQKIYIGGGVWADLVLLYRKGGWQSLPWTFPDFRCGRYDAILLRMRGSYRRALRKAGIRAFGS